MAKRFFPEEWEKMSKEELFAKKILNRQPSAIGFQPLSFCIGKLFFSLREETDFRSEKNTKETVCFYYKPCVGKNKLKTKKHAI